MRRGIECKNMQQKTVNSCKSFKDGGGVGMEWWWGCVFVSGDVSSLVHVRADMSHVRVCYPQTLGKF